MVCLQHLGEKTILSVVYARKFGYIAVAAGCGLRAARLASAAEGYRSCLAVNGCGLSLGLGGNTNMSSGLGINATA